MKYYDNYLKRLIYISNKSTPEFWDCKWKVDNDWRKIVLKFDKTFVSQITKKYLKPSDGAILEGGCGDGKWVASLINNGYDTYGIDYAANTVKALNKNVPELDIILGDIQQIPFDDNFFSGYWSLGVIEHFWNGYESILLEMYRVIKENGFLFLTFPYMSPIRKIKAKSGMYGEWKNININRFHQFALNHKRVIKDFEKIGFILIEVTPHDVITGLKDELFILRYPLNIISKYTSRFKIFGYFETLINIIMSNIASHCVLLVFKKIGSKRFLS